MSALKCARCRGIFHAGHKWIVMRWANGAGFDYVHVDCKHPYGKDHA